MKAPVMDTRLFTELHSDAESPHLTANECSAVSSPAEKQWSNCVAVSGTVEK